MLVMSFMVHIFVALFGCFRIHFVLLLNDFTEVYSYLWMTVYSKCSSLHIFNICFVFISCLNVPYYFVNTFKTWHLTSTLVHLCMTIVVRCCASCRYKYKPSFFSYAMFYNYYINKGLSNCTNHDVRTILTVTLILNIIHFGRCCHRR